MISGFDYGTSNCAMGVIKRSDTGAQVELLPIEQGRAFMPSTLYALQRELICESVGLQMPASAIKDEYIRLRSNPLGQARRVREEEGIRVDEEKVFFGSQAFEHYFSDPEEGYFVKSPKSFLGASGLRSEFMFFFEDIVTAMMQSIKQRAESALGEEINHTVIGRPVNFQGINAQDSNQQALNILSVAAKRAGFKSVDFLYEPIAAGLHFEERLEHNKTVMVVDVGGGTTDCAMVKMGPSHRSRTERQQDFIGHSGERIGGNDLDIQLAGKKLMPLLGMLSEQKSGLPMPMQVFWDAVSTNDVAAQAKFNSLQTTLQLEQLLRDAKEPNLLQRFINMREEKQNHHIVRSAEECKIALSDQDNYALMLNYIDKGLSCRVSREDFSAAINRPILRMLALMEEVINQAGCKPDLIYVTGGTAKSPVIRRAIEQKLGTIEVLDGDHFGSVASGLTVWANRIFA